MAKVLLKDEDPVIITGSSKIGFEDFIRVPPSAPRKRDGFIGIVRAVWIDNETGEVTGIDVWGGRSGFEKMRTFHPDRVEILSARMQNKLQRDRERRAKGE